MIGQIQEESGDTREGAPECLKSKEASRRVRWNLSGGRQVQERIQQAEKVGEAPQM